MPRAFLQYSKRKNKVWEFVFKIKIADAAIKAGTTIKFNNKHARVSPFLEISSLEKDANIFIEDVKQFD